MILRLSIRANRVLLLTALSVLSFLSYFSIRTARAAHSIGRNTREGYEHAVRLEPGDARNWYLLGRFYQFDFDHSDSAAALHAFLVARSLDPHSAETLLDLATNYDEAGKLSDARAAYLEAEHVYPLSAEVAWRYGNFLLRSGELSVAFPEIRKAVELDPKRGAEAFSRCRRVTADVNEILDNVIPASLEIFLDILSDLANDSQLDVAMQVWNRARNLPGNIRLMDVTPLANALIQANQLPAAIQLWQQASLKLAVPVPSDPPGSVLWDGGFESGFFGGGLSWRFPPAAKGVQIKLDSHEKRSGLQSVQLMFTGRSNVYFSDLCHWVPVDPGKTYLFSAWVQTKSLTTDQGIRFAIYTTVAGKPQIVFTNEIHGDQPWTNLTLNWTAPQDAPVAQICAVRSPSDKPDGDIEGIAWIDDVSLTPAHLLPNDR